MTMMGRLLGQTDRVGRTRGAEPETRLAQALRLIGLALLLLLSWAGALALLPSPDRVSTQVGEPSPRTVLAPRRIVYVSEIKTEEARAAAAARVEEIYTGPNLAISDERVGALDAALARVDALRADLGLTVDERLARLAQEEPDLGLDDRQRRLLLSLDEAIWPTVRAEALRVLDIVMHDELRESQVLAKAQQGYRLVRADLSGEVRDLVIRLVVGYAAPNSFLDVEQTAEARQAARRLVEPVQWTVRAGEAIVREGEIVSPLAMERMEVLGLLEEAPRWDDLTGALLLSTALTVALSAYVFKAQPLLMARPRRQLLLVLTLIVAGVSVRLVVPGHVLTPYLFPAAAFSMLVAALLNVELAVFVSAILSVLVGFSAEGSMELVAYVLVGGVIGSLVVARVEQLSSFVAAAVYVALSNAAIVLAFQLRSHMHDTIGLLQLLGMAVGNGVLSASLAYIAFSLTGRVFGITTFVQLLELARPTHPLFRQLLIKAPGTYHHSIVVSNMAESAAQAIGADPLLVRVGSYYHDIGKIARPYFYAENQNDGDNPHDRLDPETSAEIIIAHATDGLALAHKYGLPEKVCDFIPEHHGTTYASYFYRQASRENGGEPVDEASYRYPGPRPQSKETAIVMLADSIEAAVRAKRPASQEDTAALVRQIILDRLTSGQLDEADLNMRDLDRVGTAFMGILRGVFHPRIDYPEATAPSPAEPSVAPGSAPRSGSAAPPAPPPAPRPSDPEAARP